MQSPDPVIRVRNVSHQFGEVGEALYVHALMDTSIDVARGELLCLIGPSGCGKSTLLNVIGGLTVPTTGTVTVSGKPVRGPMPRDLSFIFQENALFPWNTVLENVLLGMTFQGVARSERADRAQRALEAVGLGDRAHAHARGLSTGQRKRLELARALATRPRLLLLDEVTGGVDQATVPGLIRLVRELHETGLALVVIEHNMRVIMEISQRVVALQLGEVIADGRPAEIVRDRRVIDAYLGESWTA